MSWPTALRLAVGPVEALPPLTDPAWADWLTPAELAYCRGFARAGEHAVARRLAKLAALAALGWPEEPRWHDVEIRRGHGRGPAVGLAGEVSEWRRGRGTPVPGVSLTHAAGHAAAVAWVPPGGDRATGAGGRP